MPVSFDIELIKSSIRLSSVVGDRVTIARRTGDKCVALCPFHSEKTPSFSIDDRTGLFYCFGCGAKGDAITFISMYENLSFQEAVMKLANIAGISVRDTVNNNQELYDALEKTCLFFQKNLKSEVFSYLKSRGISGNSMKKFRIGFVSQSGLGLCRKNIPKPILVSAGLLREDGYEYFKSRIMFPIFDQKSRVIGFGGRRTLKNQVAKYMNSPECTIFRKSRSLYGVNFANESIKRLNSVVVVEGYLDVIAMHQHGFSNTVANLGTSITNEQIQNLFELSNNITFCFDGDDAGLKAVDRTADLILESIKPGFMAHFANLPQGQDPCDFLSKNKADLMADVLKSAVPHYETLFNSEVNKFKLSTVEDFINLENNLFLKIGLIKDKIVAGNYKAFFKTKLFELKGEILFKKKKNVNNSGLDSLSDIKKSKVAVSDEYGMLQCLLIDIICRFPLLVTDVNLERLMSLEIQNSVCAKVLSCLLKYKKISEASPQEIEEYLASCGLSCDLNFILNQELGKKHLFDKKRFNDKNFAELNFLLTITVCELFALRSNILKIKTTICNCENFEQDPEIQSMISNLNNLQQREGVLMEEEAKLRQIISTM